MSNRRSFATRSYPTFGKGPFNDDSPPKSVTNSPFYWWFKFLQLNDEYARSLKGEKTSIPDKICNDLGEVYGVGFKEWWKTHSHLFAEPLGDYKMHIAQSQRDLVPFDAKDAVNLVIPLTWTNIGIKRRFGEIIDKLVPRTSRGVRVKTSEAEYKLGRKWRSDAFRCAYEIYLGKQRSDAKVAQGGKKTPWADIAIGAKLPNAKGLTPGKPTNLNTDQRRIMTIIAKRHYVRALEFINAAATTKFPA